MSLKYALIGCGSISQNHIAAAINNGFEIVALSDVVQENAYDKIGRFNLPDSVKVYCDYKAVLDNEHIDLVTVATSSGSHARIAMDCIDCGCNVIIEKPIALSLQDADSIIRKAKKKNVKVCACHQNRFNPSIQKIKQAVEAGRFGRLFHGAAHIRWNRGESYYKQSPWRGTWEHDGGALMNQCIHNIDILRWIMGNEITEVTGVADNLNHGYIEAEDIGIALIKFANGSYGIVEGTTNIYPRNLEETLYIFGERGTVKAAGKSVNIIEEWLFADSLESPDEIKAEFGDNPPNEYGYAHSPLYADMVDAIENDRPPYITAEDGRRAIELVLAIYKSAAEGTSVKLPLDKCSLIDFKGRIGK